MGPPRTDTVPRAKESNAEVRMLRDIEASDKDTNNSLQ